MKQTCISLFIICNVQLKTFAHHHRHRHHGRSQRMLGILSFLVTALSSSSTLVCSAATRPDSGPRSRTPGRSLGKIDTLIFQHCKDTLYFWTFNTCCQLSAIICPLPAGLFLPVLVARFVWTVDHAHVLQLRRAEPGSLRLGLQVRAGLGLGHRPRGCRSVLSLVNGIW